MKYRITVAALISAIASTVAYAQDDTKSVLLERDGWSVNELIFNDGSQSSKCDALTYSEDRKQVLTVSGYDYDHDTITVTVKDKSWKIEDRPVSYVIGTGTSKWTANGRAWDTYISSNIESHALSQRFMKEVATGDRLTFVTDSGSPLASFSLRGSSAAMSVMADCWARLQSSTAPSADPFADNTKANPFSSEPTADPSESPATATNGYGGFEAYIINVASNAFLPLYEQKSTTAKKITGIPGDAENIYVIWCKNSGSELWCDVRWEGQRGFVLSDNLQNVEGGSG